MYVYVYITNVVTKVISSFPDSQAIGIQLLSVLQMREMPRSPPPHLPMGPTRPRRSTSVGPAPAAIRRGGARRPWQRQGRPQALSRVGHENQKGTKQERHKARKHMFLKRKQVKSCKVFKVQSKDLQKARAMVLHHVASFLASQFLTCPVLLYLLTVGEFHQQCMIYQPPV